MSTELVSAMLDNKRRRAMKKLITILSLTSFLLVVGCGVKNNPPTGPSVWDRGAYYFNNEGWVKYSQGDYLSSKAHFDTVINFISPENADAYIGKAMAMKQLGEFGDAHGYLTMAITVSNQPRLVRKSARRFRIQYVSPVDDTTAWIRMDVSPVAFVENMEIQVKLANIRPHNLDSAAVYDTLYGGPAGVRLYYKVLGYSYDGDSVLITWDSEKNFSGNDEKYFYERVDLPPDSIRVDTTFFMPDSIVVDTTYFYPVDTLNLVKCLPFTGTQDAGDTVYAEVTYVLSGTNDIECAAHIVDGAVYYGAAEYYGAVKEFRSSLFVDSDYTYDAPYADSLPGRLINSRNAKIALAQAFFNLHMYMDAAFVINDLYGSVVVDPLNPDVQSLFNYIRNLSNQGGF